MALNSRTCNLILLIATMLSARLLAQPTGTLERIKVSGISSDKYKEFAPTISADGKTLIFEWNKNKRPGEGDRWELFESRLDEKGNWSEPSPLTAINEKCNFLAGPSLSYDGNIIYFTAFIEGVTTSEDIFYSERLENKNWGPPISVGKPINTEGYEGFPSISSDNRSLYFMRINEDNGYDKKNKENCFTIHVSHKSPDGTWSEPEALPRSINSGCERDPKIMADNHTLIFSSIREGNKGKFDMYQSRLLSDGNWSDPQSLDFINSPENDQSPCISASGDVMFFCSNNDIYSIGIPKEHRQMINIVLKGNVRAAGANVPLASEIRVINTKTNELVSTSRSSASNGSYSLLLNSGNQYRVEFTNEFYLTSHTDLDFTGQESYKEISLDIGMKSDYTMKLIIKDKDLGFALTSFLLVADNTGQVLYKDSVHAIDFPTTLKLNTTKQYVLSVSAPAYAAMSQPMIFKASFSGPEMPFTVSLEHDKVSFVTDVTDVSTRQKMRTKIHYNNENKDQVIVAEAGETVLLYKGDRYQVVTSSDRGYLFSSATIVAGEATTSDLNLTVTPLREGASLTLNHITFPSNSTDLKQSSYIELDQVTDLMINNPNISIEISAHTDDVGDDDYNMTLSAKRAQAVLEYLKGKKIDSGRLVAKGYGETRPLVINDSETNRERNRRVELVILKVN